MRCPTNFKIEPLHFRGEREVESLESKYLIEGVIGKGSFGEVKKIKDKDNNQYRALKIIHKANCQKTDDFADEIEIIKKLVISCSKIIFAIRIIRILSVFTSSVKMKNITIWLLSIHSMPKSKIDFAKVEIYWLRYNRSAVSLKEKHHEFSARYCLQWTYVTEKI